MVVRYPEPVKEKMPQHTDALRIDGDTCEAHASLRGASYGMRLSSGEDILPKEQAALVARQLASRRRKLCSRSSKT